MRLVGTVAICAALAFGAAFLVGRTVGHNGSSHSTTFKLSSATVGHQTAPDPELASEFAPTFTAAKLRTVKVHHPRKRSHHAKSSPTANVGTGAPAVTTQSTTTTPAYTAPASTTPQQSSSSGQGSGTTSVGGSSKKKGSGTGTTSVGG
jgi:hypothetical protein